MIATRLAVPLALLAGLAAPSLADDATAGAFVVEPYLQIGRAPAPDRLTLLWHDDAADLDWSWSVEYHALPDGVPKTAEAAVARRIAVGEVPPYRVHRAELTGLEPGGRFAYRVLKGGTPVFEAEAVAPKAADQPYRLVVFGDGGDGSDNQKAVAHRALLERPDLVVIPGDIVYDRGRLSEYLARLWPIYNADEASPSAGAPLLRSVPFVAAPGNHDIGSRDLEKSPDGLAYFFTWDQPLNGPDAPEGPAFSPTPTGLTENIQAFRDAAGDAYPRMASFSFDYGNAHWTVLDSNPYVDWSNEALRSWVERDLASAKGATWRFVAFHHPGFSSSREHYEQQMMRRLAPVFEAGKVDLVFSGHVHNYQRSYPLKFVAGEEGDDKPVTSKKGEVITRGPLVPGRWTLDKAFDGKAKTRPDGVIYLVTGAGGRHLYDSPQQDEPDSWQTFTAKFVSKVFSLTVVEVDGPRLVVRQVTPEGEELDRFVIEK